MPAVSKAAERIPDVRALQGDSFYVLTPKPTRNTNGALTRVLGPFDDHQAGFEARTRWAYEWEDLAERAELLTGDALHQDYAGRHGVVAR